jgi:transcriptional regulator with XRE-family HTH domain
MSLPSNLRARREQLGLSQADVADAVGVTQGAVSQWELGQTELRGKNLSKVAACLQTTRSDLLADDGVSFPAVLNAEKLALALTCLESGLGQDFQSLVPMQKAKLLKYVYSKGHELSKQELLALLSLVQQ